MNSPNAQEGPKQLGDFEIVRELGRGGMGVVYEARQRSLNRQVALKVLSTGLGLTTKAIMRFKREAEAAAKLHHTNIVPIYFTGAEDRVPYYAMELVDGPSLDKVIRQLRNESGTASKDSLDSADDTSHQQQSAVPEWAEATIGFVKPKSTSDGTTSTSAISDSSSSFGAGSNYYDNVATMMADVADALAHAHDQGVIHRDIKPSNLLLSPDGRLSVNDFGLARMLEQPGMTMTGEFMGSPMYMSPEQITAGRIPLDHRTDIYSLGATLYELLTLQTPFEGQQRDQVLSQIIHKEPASPRKLNKRIPQDLETICLKAMEKDPDKRYQTAELMADDLQRFVNRHAITARRIGPVGQLTRWCRRHRALSSSILLAIFLAGMVGIFAYQAHLSETALAALYLDHAVTEAMLVAMSGDEEATLSKIEEAELLGAETWVASLLRGQVALFSHRHNDAIEHLKHALKLKPESIEIKALLGRAAFEINRFDVFVPLEVKLSSAVPVTTRDKLFLGHFLSVFDPQRGLNMLMEAKREDNSGESNIARLFLAQARINLAFDTFEVETALQAVEEAGIARRLMPDNIVAWVMEFRALLVAVKVMRTANREHDANELNARALDTLERIDQFPDSILVAFAWWWQGVASDNPVERLRALERSLSVLKSLPAHYTVFFAGSYALELYLNGRILEAKQVLSSVPETGLLGSFVLAMILAEGDGVVKAANEETILARVAMAVDELYRPLVFLMLGKTDRSRAFYKEIDSSTIGSFRDGWYRRLLAFGRGEMTAEQLIATIDHPRRSHFNQCEGHFFVGMTLLSEGRHAEADEHFEKSVEAGVFEYRDHELARAILAKRKADPQWPAWIPARKEPSTSEVNSPSRTLRKRIGCLLPTSSGVPELGPQVASIDCIGLSREIAWHQLHVRADS